MRVTSLEDLAYPASQGCNGSLQRLIEKLRPTILRYFRRRYSTHDAEDLCQEVLFAICRQIMKFDANRPIWPWVMTIAHHKWVDQLRWHNRQLSLQYHNDLEDISAEYQDNFELNLSVKHAVFQLPSKQKEALLLTKILGVSVKEASAITGQSETSIKQNVFRAKKRMRAELEDCE